MAGYDGSITLTPAQLAMLIEGIDWRAPERVWKPALAGCKASETSIESSEFASSNQAIWVDSDMRFDLDNLPSEPALLLHLIRDMAAAVEQRDGEIERLKSIIKTLQRAQVGRRSERLDPDQLALALEGVDSDLAREEEKRPPGEKQAGERPSRRKPLPVGLCA